MNNSEEEKDKRLLKWLGASDAEVARIMKNKEHLDSIDREIEMEEEKKRKEYLERQFRKKFLFRYWIGRWAVGADFGDYGIFDVPIMLLTLPFLYAYKVVDVWRYGHLQHFLRVPSRLECICRCLILVGAAAVLFHWLSIYF